MNDNLEITKRPDKKNMQVVQQIFHNLTEVVELHPKYPIGEHLAAILRRKNSTGKEFFFWTNEELLKRIEQYKSELEGEELLNIEDLNDND